MKRMRRDVVMRRFPKGGARRRGGRSVICVLALAAVPVTWSCAGDASVEGAWGGTVDTLAGGGIRVVSPDKGLWSEGAEWRVEEDLRIGSLQSEGPDMFGEIADLAVDGAGKIFVLEQQAHELRVFDADGSYIRTIGREGAGPGELNLGFGGEVFIKASGRIWINNFRNRRWELFSTEGEPMASTPMMGRVMVSNTVMGKDGVFHERGRVRPTNGGESRPVIIRKQVRGDSLVVLDTIDAPRLPEGEAIQASLSSGGRMVQIILPVPFVHQPRWSFDPAGYFWVAPDDGYRLLALSPDLDTLRIIERLFEPVPVTSAEIDEITKRYMNEVLAGTGVTIDRSRIPDHHPAIDTYQTDADGNLWVRRSLGGDLIAWEVFDEDGRFLGKVESDLDLERLTVHEITSDAVYGVFRDDLDVQYVVRLRIRKGG